MVGWETRSERGNGRLVGHITIDVDEDGGAEQEACNGDCTSVSRWRPIECAVRGGSGDGRSVSSRSGTEGSVLDSGGLVIDI